MATKPFELYNYELNGPCTDKNSREPAKIARHRDGAVAGVAVVLSSSDLRRLGINLNETNAVLPRIRSGAVLIEPVEG